MNLTDIQNRLSEISVDVEALIEVAGDNPSEEHQEQILALNSEAKDLEAKLDEVKKFEKAKADIVARRKLAAEASSAHAAGVQPSVSEEPKDKNMALPAKAKYAKSRHFDNNEDAYVSGMFLAALGGNTKAKEFMAAQSLTDSKGGFSVPTPLSDQLINLVEEYGHARKSCRRIVMGATTWERSKDHWSLGRLLPSRSCSNHRKRSDLQPNHFDGKQNGWSGQDVIRDCRRQHHLDARHCCR